MKNFIDKLFKSFLNTSERTVEYVTVFVIMTLLLIFFLFICYILGFSLLFGTLCAFIICLPMMISLLIGIRK